MEELLDALESLTEERQYPAKFGAKVYKIGRDEQGNRLTYLKVTGGSIKVREIITDTEEKINQIRRYSGAKYEMLSEVQDRVRPARTAARRRGRCAAADRYPGDHLGKAPGTPF